MACSLENFRCPLCGKQLASDEYQDAVGRLEKKVAEKYNEKNQQSKQDYEKKIAELTLGHKTEVKNQFLEAETVRMKDKHEDRTEDKEHKAEFEQKQHRPSKDEKILSIMENYHPSPEQLQDSEFMAKRKKAIADLKQKIAQTKGDQK